MSVSWQEISYVFLLKQLSLFEQKRGTDIKGREGAHQREENIVKIPAFGEV